MLSTKMWRMPRYSAEAAMGSISSSVLILIVLKKVHGHIGINDNLSSILNAGEGEETVLIAPGGEVTHAEEILNSFESINVALPRCCDRRNGFYLLLADGVFEQFLKVRNGERCDGCRVFDKHSSTEIKLMKTQPVVRVMQINLSQRWAHIFKLSRG